MLGGSPGFYPQGQIVQGPFPGMAPVVYGPPAPAVFPGSRQQQPAAQQPVARAANGQGQAGQPIVARGKADDPAPARFNPVSLPDPEKMNVVANRPYEETVDWARVRGQLGQLHALSFQLDRMPDGGYRFGCLLAMAPGTDPQRVEVLGHTEAEAVRAGLDRAERIRSGRP
jgi:hypothetical protein